MHSPESQVARAELLALHERHRAIREAWRALIPYGPDDGDFDFFLHPERVRRDVKPPKGRRAYLLWFAAAEVEPWLPTHDERAARAHEVWQESRRGRPSRADIGAILGAG